MTRAVLVASIAIATAILALNLPADAVTESCPARLASQAVSSRSENARGPATLFGFELSAYGPRSVSATLAFDTDRGWFSVDVPAVALAEKDRHYSVGFARDTIRDWISPVMYVRFPSAVQMKHSWVFSAAATGDGTFGWEQIGRVACSPPTPSMETSDTPRTISATTTVRSGGGRPSPAVVLDSADKDNLSAAPGATSRVFDVMPTQPRGTTDCEKPFVEASPRQIVAPGFPATLAGSPFPGIVGVRIALNADGSLADAWVWASSGHQAYDETALHAIHQSTYAGAESYCHPVPSQYNAFIFFDPS